MPSICTLFCVAFSENALFLTFRLFRSWNKAKDITLIDRLENRGVGRGLSARRPNLKWGEEVIVGQTNIGAVAYVSKATLIKKLPRDKADRMRTFLGS